MESVGFVTLISVLVAWTERGTINDHKVFDREELWIKLLETRSVYDPNGRHHHCEVRSSRDTNPTVSGEDKIERVKNYGEWKVLDMDYFYEVRLPIHDQRRSN